MYGDIEGWNITCPPNHWSNGNTMLEYVNEILIPYVTDKRKELKLAMDYPALVLFDTFKGQCTNEVYDHSCTAWILLGSGAIPFAEKTCPK